MATTMNSNISNLNVLTFIKDIYNSLLEKEEMDKEIVYKKYMIDNFYVR